MSFSASELGALLPYFDGVPVARHKAHIGSGLGYEGRYCLLIIELKPIAPKHRTDPQVDRIAERGNNYYYLKTFLWFDNLLWTPSTKSAIRDYQYRSSVARPKSQLTETVDTVSEQLRPR